MHSLSSIFSPRFATVPQYSQRSTLMHYQMAGRSMHGAGSTKESFCGQTQVLQFHIDLHWSEIQEIADCVQFWFCRNKCSNRTVCMEKLSLVLPETSPYVPQQFGRCAVVGNSGDLLKTKFGDEIDSYDVVIRENGAPVQVFLKYFVFSSLLSSLGHA